MRLPPPLIASMVRGMMRNLEEANVIASDNPRRTLERIEHLIAADLRREDEITEEARLVLMDYQDQIRGADMEYHTLLSKAKAQIAQKKGYLLSRGEEKLSREKQHDLARQIVALFMNDDDIEYFIEERELHPAVARAIEREMRRDAAREEKARRKVMSIKRNIPPGSGEFETLARQFYNEFLDKEG